MAPSLLRGPSPALIRSSVWVPRSIYLALYKLWPSLPGALSLVGEDHAGTVGGAGWGWGHAGLVCIAWGGRQASQKRWHGTEKGEEDFVGRGWSCPFLGGCFLWGGGGGGRPTPGRGNSLHSGPEAGSIWPVHGRAPSLEQLEDGYVFKG